MKRLFLLLTITFGLVTNIKAQIVAAKSDADRMYGFVDANDNWVVLPTYTTASWNDYIELGEFSGSNGSGTIDKNGKIFFRSSKYASFSRPSKTCNLVSIYQDKFGVITMEGEWILPCKYKYVDIREAKPNTFIILTNDDEKVGVAASNGKMLVPCEYLRGEIHGIFLNEQYICMTDFEGKQALFSPEGKQLTPCDFDDISEGTRGIIVTKKVNGRRLSGAYSLEGKELARCEYDYVYFMDNHPYIRVTKKNNGKDLNGLFSINGEVVLPCEYYNISFERNMIWVTKEVGGDKRSYGIYSLKGEQIVPCQYANIDRLTQANEPTQIFALQDEKFRALSFIAIDTQGKVIVPFNKYQGIKKAAQNLYTIQQNGKWGLWTEDYEVIPCQYDEPVKFENDVATVKKDGEVRLIKNPLKDGSQILIAEAKTPNKKKAKGPAISRYPKPDSDVDINIPVAKKQAETTFAFIICNENYPDAPVPYSLNDGRMFREYCQKTLGIPEKNINMYEDATYGNIITAVEKMKTIAEAYEGDANVIFYYAGHGFPDDKQATAYLLPIDGDASSITTTGYSLAKLYKEIASLKLKSSIVFLDACFSGAKREDEMLTSARGVAIKVKAETPQGNMVVFSAAQGDETAHQLEEKHHGLFTYCLLKELQTAQGDMDLGTLTDNVTRQVKRQSVVINNKRQTPTVIPSTTLNESWRNIKMK